jgi:hypothetical protein
MAKTKTISLSQSAVSGRGGGSGGKGSRGGGTGSRGGGTGSRGGGTGSRGGGTGSRGGGKSSRGGGKGSRVEYDPLQAAINEQDNAAIEKTNSYVLGVIANTQDYFDEDYGDGDDDEEEEDDGDDEILTQTQASVQSEPAVGAKANGSKAQNSKFKNARTKTAHLKNPVQACDIMMKNLELFQRALEKKQNNQFQLVNENFNSFQENTNSVINRLYKSQQAMLKLLNNMSDCLKYNSNNTALAVRKSTLKNASTASSSLIDEIILDDDDYEFEQKSIYESVVASNKQIIKKEGQDCKMTNQINGAQNGMGFVGMGYVGMGQNGLVQNGMGLNGMVQNGMVQNGMVQNGMGLNGMVHNGMIQNGMGLNGMVQNGEMGHMSGPTGYQMSQMAMNSQFGSQICTGQTSSGFGGANLMAGLGCFSLDLNTNNVNKNFTSSIDSMGLKKATSGLVKPTLIAGAAFDFIFQHEINGGLFSNGDYNVYGNAPNGQKTVYLPLNAAKMEILESHVKDRMDQGADKDGLWKKCVKALNRKLWKLSAKNVGKQEPELSDTE